MSWSFENIIETGVKNIENVVDGVINSLANSEILIKV